METKTTLVSTESSIVLYTVTEVNLSLTLIVNPYYTEFEDTIWFNKTFNDLCSFEFRMLVVNFFY